MRQFPIGVHNHLKPARCTIVAQLDFITVENLSFDSSEVAIERENLKS